MSFWALPPAANAQCTTGHPAYCEHFGALNFGGCRSDGTGCLHDEAGKVSSHFFGQSSFASHAVWRRAMW
jgi:aryl-alcohol dehydrogenase